VVQGQAVIATIEIFYLAFPDVCRARQQARSCPLVCEFAEVKQLLQSVA
jgi:hypothetical protein